MAVSADAEMPCLTEALSAMGADVIVSPCAWTCESGSQADRMEAVRRYHIDRTTAAPVALISVNGVCTGASQDEAMFGGSMVSGRGGRELMAGPVDQEALLAVEIPTNVVSPT